VDLERGLIQIREQFTQGAWSELKTAVQYPARRARDAGNGAEIFVDGPQLVLRQVPQPVLAWMAALQPGEATTPQSPSHEIPAGKSWKYTPREAGEYANVCTLHPITKGTLKVEYLRGITGPMPECKIVAESSHA
jgi:hypothetical protein